MEINEKYSYKDFTNQKLTAVDPAEFNNTEIIGSCFYQEGDPDQAVFPEGIFGVKFTKCNLDNVDIPNGNVVQGDCSSRRIKVQNDLEDWVLDNDNKPVEPTDVERFVREGKSIDPANIPSEKIGG